MDAIDGRSLHGLSGEWHRMVAAGGVKIVEVVFPARIRTFQDRPLWQEGKRWASRSLSEQQFSP
jgi:hypothetical protein